MPCERIPVNEFHSREQQRYTADMIRMLQRSEDFHRFAADREQTESLRNAWIIGAMLLGIVMYFDAIFYLSHNISFWGASLTMMRDVHQVWVSLLFLAYPVGLLLVAPWFGWHGPIEDTQVSRVVLAHISAAAILVLQPIEVAPFIRPRVWTSVLPCLLPLFTGLILRYANFGGKWKFRPQWSAPLFWLPPLHAAFTTVLWYAAAKALADNNDVITLGYFSKRVPAAIADVLAEMVVAPSNIRLYAAVTSNCFIAAQLLVLLLLASLIEVIVLVPTIKFLVFPNTPRRWALQIACCAVVLYRYFPSDATSGFNASGVQFWYFLLLSYAVGLLFKGISLDDD